MIKYTINISDLERQPVFNLPNSAHDGSVDKIVDIIIERRLTFAQCRIVLYGALQTLQSNCVPDALHTQKKHPDIPAPSKNDTVFDPLKPIEVEIIDLLLNADLSFAEMVGTIYKSLWKIQLMPVARKTKG